MKQMMMSKQEIKDEYKQLEGDPQVKGQRQQLYQEIGQHNMVQDVKNASVVIVNPDEIAVALTYDNKTMNAPRVTAKGRNEIAKSIKEIAKEYDIPIVTNVNLAHSLLALDLGQDVPENLYEAVAEVLRYIYELSGKE
jgi:flagellar biosynthetic protein FlhB